MTNGQTALELLDEQLQELSNIVKRASFDFDYETGEERLKRWKSRTIKLISDKVNPREGEKLIKIYISPSIDRRRQENLEDSAKLYRGFLLSLKGELLHHPENILAPGVIEAQMKGNLQKKIISEQTRDKNDYIWGDSDQIHQRKIFIVFGKDELNSLRLEKVMREFGKINLELLNSNVSKNENFLEKLDRGVYSNSCAFFLFSVEDFAKKTGGKVPLANPGFIFSLGWFCGNFGFERVCILFKKGLKLPAGLADLTNIEFEYSVSDVATKIDQKLKEFGII